MNHRLKILLVLSICLAGRLGYFLAVATCNHHPQHKVLLVDDAEGYERLGYVLAQSGEYDTGELGALRPPVYPGIIAACYMVFGTHLWVVVLFQIAMDTATCLLIILTVRRMLNASAAVWAGLLYAISPFPIIHCSRILCEIPFLFFCALSLYYIGRVMRPKEPGDQSVFMLFVVGIVLGFATLTKPVAVCLPVLFIFAMLVRRLKKPATFLAQAAAVAAAFAAVVAPWCWRNHRVYDHYGISTSGDYNLLVLHVAGMEVARTGEDYETVKRSLLFEAEKMIENDGHKHSKMNPFEKAAYWKRLAKNKIRRNPGDFAKASAMGVVHSFMNLGTQDISAMLGLPGDLKDFDFNAYPNIFDAIAEWFRVKSAAQIAAGAVVAVLLLAIYVSLLVGLFVAWRSGSRAFLLLCALGAIYFIIVAGPAGLGRFRMPAIPFYMPFAGAGLAWIVGKRKQNIPV